MMIWLSSYVRNMHFSTDVDYDFIKENLSNMLRNSGNKNDGIFDWHTQKVVASVIPQENISDCRIVAGPRGRV